jgi:acetyl-CoA C-acetyltransferase
MVDALERAASDAGTTGVLDSIDELVAVSSFTWHTNDPALLVAERLGLHDVTTRLTPIGGNVAQQLVHESARRILGGDVTTVAVVGAEAMNAQLRARRVELQLEWVRQPDDVAIPLDPSEDRTPLTEAEYSQGLRLPIEVYPLFENARRARLGWSLDGQRAHLGTLWSNFSKVAASNPYAWLPTYHSPEEIAMPSAGNRMVSYPYTKLLIANVPVDTGAAYIITSYEHAQKLGVAKDRMVFPQLGADANDHWFVSERPQLDDSPAMRALWRTLTGFGAGADDLAHIDLYSCFPTVVQTACEVLGIDAYDTSRIPTLTGGLTFGGGPGNNYTTHAIASMVDALRADPTSRGLVTALGWFSTKHSWGTYAATPPAGGFRWAAPQADIDALPHCRSEQLSGDVTVESYTVTHARDGSPTSLIVAARTSDATRVWCHSDDVLLMHDAETTEIIGRAGEVHDNVFAM